MMNTVNRVDSIRFGIVRFFIWNEMVNIVGMRVGGVGINGM